MNQDAYRAAWQNRYAGTLEGRAAFLTALVMAELAEPASGTVTVGARTLAEITGYGPATVRQAIADAGLFQMADAGTGRRPARYVLACPPPRAMPVDNPAADAGSVSPAARNSARPSDRSARFARGNGAVAYPPPRAQLEPKTLEPRISARHFEDDPDLTPPCDLPERVDALRAAMEAEPPPVAPLEVEPPPCLVDAVPPEEVAERVAELRSRMVGRRRHPAGGGQR